MHHQKKLIQNSHEGLLKQTKSKLDSIFCKSVIISNCLLIIQNLSSQNCFVYDPNNCIKYQLANYHTPNINLSTNQLTNQSIYFYVKVGDKNKATQQYSKESGFFPYNQQYSKQIIYFHFDINLTQAKEGAYLISKQIYIFPIQFQNSIAESFLTVCFTSS
ncbi:hypothetical protein ABPG72_010871 [Tetrahymena utriculariae]